MKSILPEDLVCMDALPAEAGIAIELAYARDNNFLFGERIYRADARLYLHRFMADIVIRAGGLAQTRHGLHLVLYDGLRTMDAQARMLETQRVRDNPHWVEQEPRLLSPPGAGGHPRGMAVDLSLADAQGNVLDMGTPFDFLAENPHAPFNAAHRDSPQTNDVAQNRTLLDSVMIDAASAVGQPIFPLPQEWWDYRLPPSLYEAYAPLSDADLPTPMRLMT